MEGNMFSSRYLKVVSVSSLILFVIFAFGLSKALARETPQGPLDESGTYDFSADSSSSYNLSEFSVDSSPETAEPNNLESYVPDGSYNDLSMDVSIAKEMKGSAVQGSQEGPSYHDYSRNISSVSEDALPIRQDIFDAVTATIEPINDVDPIYKGYSNLYPSKISLQESYASEQSPDATQAEGVDINTDPFVNWENSLIVDASKMFTVGQGERTLLQQPLKDLNIPSYQNEPIGDIELASAEKWVGPIPLPIRENVVPNSIEWGPQLPPGKNFNPFDDVGEINIEPIEVDPDPITTMHLPPLIESSPDELLNRFWLPEPRVPSYDPPTEWGYINPTDVGPLSINPNLVNPEIEPDSIKPIEWGPQLPPGKDINPFDDVGAIKIDYGLLYPAPVLSIEPVRINYNPLPKVEPSFKFREPIVPSYDPPEKWGYPDPPDIDRLSIDPKLITPEIFRLDFKPLLDYSLPDDNPPDKQHGLTPLNSVDPSPILSYSYEPEAELVNINLMTRRALLEGVGEYNVPDYNEANQTFGGLSEVGTTISTDVFNSYRDDLSGRGYDYAPDSGVGKIQGLIDKYVQE